MNVRSAILDCRNKFKAAGIDAAALEAELLVGLACCISRTKLMASPDKKLTRRQSVRLRSLLRRRLTRIPFAYLSGEKEFRGLSFRVGRGVFIPRPETELLVELALKEAARLAGGSAADICAGCGALAVALAYELPLAWKILATDISPGALKYASLNLKRHNLARRVKLLRGNLYAPLKRLPTRGGYQLLVANPPYVAERDKRGLQREVAREPGAALFAGYYGLEIIIRLVVELDGLLAPDGALIFELSPEQVAAVRKLLKPRFRQVEFHRDLARRYRAVVARYPFVR